MCLAALSFNSQPGFDLILIANRDEFFKRPTEKAHFWGDAPQLLAGRDLESGGTWLGVTRDGRVAFLTNYRDPSRNKETATSRGKLVSDYLTGSMAPKAYLEGILPRAHEYNDFNLIVGSAMELHYLSSIEKKSVPIEPGLHGISNHLLDTPWPKVVRARKRFSEVLASPGGSALPVNELFNLLRDPERAPDETLPRTGVGLDWERDLSPIFITLPGYGTRSSSILAIRSCGEVIFQERAYSEDRNSARDSKFQFPIEIDPSK